MFLRELPVDSAYTRLKTQQSRYFFFMIVCALIFLFMIVMLYSDIQWSWDGFDPILGEHAFEGFALSFLTTGLEILPSILVAGGVVKKGSIEYKVLWGIAGGAYAIDIGTNYLGLSTRKGKAEWGLTSEHFISQLGRAFTSILVSFTEMFIFWFLEATTICYESYQAVRKTVKNMHSKTNKGSRAVNYSQLQESDSEEEEIIEPKENSGSKIVPGFQM